MIPEDFCSQMCLMLAELWMDYFSTKKVRYKIIPFIILEKTEETWAVVLCFSSEAINEGLFYSLVKTIELSCLINIK